MLRMYMALAYLGLQLRIGSGSILINIVLRVAILSFDAEYLEADQWNEEGA